MAALDFPSSPSVGQTYTANGLTYQWDGTTWFHKKTNTDASKIANGNVSNTEFQYLDGVTSSIQTQLNTNATTIQLNLANTNSWINSNLANTNAWLANTNSWINSNLANTNAWITTVETNQQTYLANTNAWLANTNSWIDSLPGGLNISGTPANNQISIWTNADTLEGDANFTWDGDAQLLTVTGRRYTVTSNTVNKPAASTDFYRDQYEWSLSQGSPNLTSSPNFYQQYIKGTIGLTNAGSGSNALNYSNIYNTVTFNSAGSGSTARINNIYSLYNYLTLSAQAGEIVDSARTVYNRLYISDDVKGDNNGTFDAYVVENRVDTLNNSLGKIGNLIGEKVFFNITNSGSSITTAKSYEARFSSSATIANGYLFDGYYVGTLPTNAYGFRFYNASNAGNGDLTSIHDGDIEPYTTLAGNLGSATTYWGGIYVDNVFISGEVSANSSVGTAGQVLTSGGTGANTFWSTVTGGGGATVAVANTAFPGYKINLTAQTDGQDFSTANIQPSFTTVDYDLNSNFNTSNQKFTAPYKGLYTFSVTTTVYNAGGGDRVEAQAFINGSAVSGNDKITSAIDASSDTNQGLNGTLTYQLNQNDTFEWRYYAPDTSIGFRSNSSHSGYLIQRFE